ncbi:MAG: class I SAM-dependent methyltransferase [Planctomycetota bacterium]|jgi:ubiquinone/menaquinone biosynthesis C-methylase UbiE
MAERENPTWIDELFKSPVYEQEYAGTESDAERAIEESKFIAEQLELKNTDRVFDLACGSGRHVLLIAEQAGSVVGLDISERFIAKAVSVAEENKIGNIEFAAGDMRDIEYDREFDAAYNFFTAWGYYSDEENFDILVRVFRALRPGGRFLLEMINRDALMRRFHAQNWHELKDGTLVLSEQSFDLSSGRMTSSRTYLHENEKRIIEIVHHIPSSDELVRMFERAGFSDVRLVASPGGGEAGIDTKRIAVIGKKNA